MTSVSPSTSPPDRAISSASSNLPRLTQKGRSQFLAILREYLNVSGIDLNSAVLVIGGTQEDAEVLLQSGFRQITLSNIEGTIDQSGTTIDHPVIAVDAENSCLADCSFDIVFVHEALHHCRSAHRALCEMLRIAKRQVILMEPNDSAVMRLLARMGFSFPFEIAAVVDNDYVRGGVRNSQVPNFIYRWNRREVHKASSAFLAECIFRLYAYPYWDFNVDEKNLAYRKQTRISTITSIIGAKKFLQLLHVAQVVLNRVSPLRRQGNKFFCAIEKTSELQPWLIREQDGAISFNRDFQRPLDL